MQQFATGMYLDYNQARLLAWGYGGGGADYAHHTLTRVPAK